MQMHKSQYILYYLISLPCDIGYFYQFILNEFIAVQWAMKKLSSRHFSHPLIKECFKVLIVLL